MTGSSLVPIVVPIVAILTLTAWLSMVYYAAAHPGWKSRPASSQPSATGALASIGAGTETPRPDGVSVTGHGTAATPRGAEERSTGAATPPPSRAA
jgi:hypothetical protein